MEIGVLYLSHAMLILAELIVCSMRGFACILAKWFWPTVMSLSLTYEVPRPINHPVVTFKGSGYDKRKRDYNLCRVSSHLMYTDNISTFF